MTIARRGTVAGRVQGVGFRYRTQREARRLSLAGWVRNLPDGRVEFEVVGEPQAVEELLAWLRKGPAPARVSEFLVEELPAQRARSDAADDFEILR